MDHRTFQDSSAGHVLHVPGRDYWAFIPNPLPPPLAWTEDLVAALSLADRSLGELAGLGWRLPNPHLLITPFLRREAVVSSQIEGTQASLTDLYVFEAQQLPLFGQPADVREVYNYVKALEYGLERLTTLPLSLRLIRELHERLTSGVRGAYQTPGEFRHSQNWIGALGCTLNDATYVPPPPEELLDALSALEQFMHAETTLPPLIRLGMIHYQFEAIHPFLDGNGRVGRLLIVLILCAWKLLPQPLLYLSVYFEAHRQEYYAHLLSVSQRGAWDEWLRFFLRGVAQQAQDAVSRAGRLQMLREDYRRRLQSADASARLLDVVDLLFARPLVSIAQVAQALGVSFPQATRYIEALVRAGMLREITGRARGRIYQEDAVMDVLEESHRGNG